jgi:uncharacterized membrane protein
VFAIWATDVSITVCCGSYLLFSGQLTKLWQVFKRHPIILLTQSFLDNVSWLAYAGAVLFLPISIAIGISESYVAIAVLLGLIFNREKLKFHQLLGVGLVTFGVVCLAFLTA